MSIVARQAFNPFTARQRNTKVKWFEADLDAFYMFVEDQPLLTAEQELQYGKALKMWIQVENVREQLSTKEGSAIDISNEDLAKHIGCSVTTLEKMSKYADISKVRLVNSNLKLVLAVVSRYRTSAIPNAELIAEGTRGLAKAVMRYDYSKGFRFATYATWYVHQAIAEYVRWRKHPAKMPSRYLLLLRKVKEFTAQYKEVNNRTPSITEIATELGQSHFDIAKVMSMQTYPTLLCAPVKAGKPGSEGRERTFEDLVPSLYKAPIALSDSKDLRREMETMMQSNLNEVERDVLRLRLGLDDGRAKAVKEVGKRFKISWKQVRSVEKEALSKLLDSEEISEFVDSYHRV
jgi:RNA polymerase sigma factor (sigma-70 family)